MERAVLGKRFDPWTESEPDPYFVGAHVLYLQLDHRSGRQAGEDAIDGLDRTECGHRVGQIGGLDRVEDVCADTGQRRGPAERMAGCFEQPSVLDRRSSSSWRRSRRQDFASRRPRQGHRASVPSGVSLCRYPTTYWVRMPPKSWAQTSPCRVSLLVMRTPRKPSGNKHTMRTHTAVGRSAPIDANSSRHGRASR